MNILLPIHITVRETAKKNKKSLAPPPLGSGQMNGYKFKQKKIHSGQPLTTTPPPFFAASLREEVKKIKCPYPPPYPLPKSQSCERKLTLCRICTDKLRPLLLSEIKNILKEFKFLSLYFDEKRDLLYL